MAVAKKASRSPAKVSRSPAKKDQPRAKKAVRGRARRAASASPRARRPLTSYILFAIDHREKVKKDNPGIAPTEIMRELGRLWRAQSAAAKKVYQDRYDASKRRADASASPARRSASPARKSASPRKVAGRR